MMCSNNINCPYSIFELPSSTIIVRFRYNTSDLNNALNSYVFPEEMECLSNQCNGTVDVPKILQSHVFIEIDVFADDQQTPLREISLKSYFENQR